MSNILYFHATVLAPEVAPSIVPPSLIIRDANDVSPDLNLTCTVSGEGRFRWEWTGPGGITPSNVQLYDLTRTSTASFTGIRGGGDGFQCRATYSPVIPTRTNVPAFAMSDSQDVAVWLECKYHIVSLLQDHFYALLFFNFYVQLIDRILSFRLLDVTLD